MSLFTAVNAASLRFVIYLEMFFIYILNTISNAFNPVDRKFCWYSKETELFIFSKDLFANDIKRKHLLGNFKYWIPNERKTFSLKEEVLAIFTKFVLLKSKVSANLLSLRAEGFSIQKPKKLQSRIGLFQY